eukprot:scaffold238545_cov30-Tisochrysis_lutea.AAC.4
MEAEAAASNPFSRGNANPCSVAVVGVGGAGCNALARLPSWLIGGSSDGKEAGTNANAGSVRTFDWAGQCTHTRLLLVRRRSLLLRHRAPAR